jgi:hypothetical protein
MLLIHPPVTKPCEPPAGIACLAGVLKSHGIPFRVFDANVEAIRDLVNRSPAFLDFEKDTWTKRSFRNRLAHLDTIKNIGEYTTPSRYRRAVGDLNRILEKGGEPWQARIGLGNYQHRRLSPTNSADLIRAAGQPVMDPFRPFYESRLTELLGEENPEWIGISLNFLNQAIPAFALIGFLKERAPCCRLILGGGLITSWMRKPGWQNPFGGLVDEMIAGPGETPLLAVCGVREGVHPQSLPDFDSFPLSEYLAPGLVLPYAATRGCYWNRCLFCPEKAEENPYTAVGTERAVADLSSLVAKYRPALVHLLDNAIPPAVLAGIAAKPFGAPWYGFARVTPHLADPDFCRGLRRSGCVMLQLGVESGDQMVLDYLEKGIDLAIVSKALDNLHSAGIAAYVYLLFGTPPETLEEARRTLEFTVRHSEKISFLNLALFNLPLHGPGAAGLRREKFCAGDLSLYTDFAHPRGWNRYAVRQFLDKEFRRHPAIAAILLRDPPVFTSSHAAFFGTARGQDKEYRG